MSSQVWCRLYAEILDDPKVGMLEHESWRCFVELMALACERPDEGGRTVNIEQFSWRVRRDVSEAVKPIIANGLVGVDSDGVLRLKSWNRRQYKSDSSTARVRKHRAQKQRNVSGNGDGTLPKRPQRQSRADPEQIPPSGRDARARGSPGLAQGELDAARSNGARNGHAPAAEAMTEVEAIYAALNEHTGKTYRARHPDGALTQGAQHVLALFAHGWEARDCRFVVARKCRDWAGDPHMAGMLKPSVLFNPAKFAEYRGETDAER